jgi:hypothetical protein
MTTQHPSLSYIENLSVDSLTFPTLGGVATPLDYYEEGTFLATYAGPWAANTNVTVHYVKVGTKVTLQFPAYLNAFSVATIITVSGIPTRFYPKTGSFYFPAVVIDNTVGAVGALEIKAANSGGPSFAFYNASFYAGGTGNFTVGQVGVQATSVTYITV